MAFERPQNNKKKLKVFLIWTEQEHIFLIRIALNATFQIKNCLYSHLFLL